MWVYVGTYQTGVYRLGFDPGTGGLSEAAEAGEAVKPSFLALHPTRPVLYAVHGAPHAPDPARRGWVRAFAIDGDGGLSVAGEQPVGAHPPCHLAVSRGGRRLLVSNYHDATVAVLPLGEAGEPEPAAGMHRHRGSGPDPERQRSAHVHSATWDPRERFVHVADLGADRLSSYRVDGDALVPWDAVGPALAPGSGPRHLAFAPDGETACLINELASTLAVLAYDGDRGRFAVLQVLSTLPPGEDRAGNTAAEVAFHPSGRFVYGSNRGHDSIVTYRVEAGGRLRWAGTCPSGGAGPRHFALDPAGRWLVAANQHSDGVAVFAVDPERGVPEPTGVRAAVPAPVCVRFVPAALLSVTDCRCSTGAGARAGTTRRPRWPERR